MAITTKCTHKCPGDKECTCNGLVRHAHHICRDVTCRCHSAEAYGLEAMTVDHQAVYVTRLRRLEEGTSASPLP